MAGDDRIMQLGIWISSLYSLHTKASFLGLPYIMFMLTHSTLQLQAGSNPAPAPYSILERWHTIMTACIALMFLMGLAVVRQEDMTEIREIEEAQEKAPRKRRKTTKRRYRRSMAC